VRSVCFSSARVLGARAAEGVVTNVLTVHVPYADRYLTGACVGGDAFIGRWLHEHRPHAEHVVIVPADRSRVDPWWESVLGAPVTVIEMPEGSTYEDRNARLVAEASAVFAFPAYPEDDPRSRRSGTWQTARMARRSGNFSAWHCVTPPYAGRIERYADELLGVVVHACPPDGGQVTPCCGMSPFDLPRTDRMTGDPSAVSCFAVTEPEAADDPACE
jgi:hypothetical protein